MTWTRLDDTWGDDPVFDTLDHQARWHYLMMIQVCSRGERYDGTMRLAKARQCSDVDDAIGCIAALVASGLVVNVDGDMLRVVRIDQHVPSKEVLDAKEQTKLRMRRHRKHKAGDHSECQPGKCSESGDVAVTSLPTSREQASHPPARRDREGRAVTGKNSPHEENDLSEEDQRMLDEYNAEQGYLPGDEDFTAHLEAS